MKTRITTPRGQERQDNRTANLQAELIDATRFVTEQAMLKIDKVAPEHAEAIFALHAKQWRQVFNHVITNHANQA